MQRKRHILRPGLIVAGLFNCYSIPVFAITEAEVQAQVAIVGRESVTGNVFIWFLCAVAFLKVSQKIDSNFTWPKRLMASFGITDEIFAVSMQRKKALSFTYMIGLIVTPVLGWTFGTLTGAVATSLLPEVLSDAMGIALYGMFVAIIVPPAREHKNVMFAVLVAIAASYVFAYVPALGKISGGWSVIIITVVVSAIAAVLFPVAEKEDA